MNQAAVVVPETLPPRSPRTSPPRPPGTLTSQIWYRCRPIRLPINAASASPQVIAITPATAIEREPPDHLPPQQPEQQRNRDCVIDRTGWLSSASIARSRYREQVVESDKRSRWAKFRSPNGQTAAVRQNPHSAMWIILQVSSGF